MSIKCLAQCLVQSRHSVNVGCFMMKGRCGTVNEKTWKNKSFKKYKNQKTQKRNSFQLSKDVISAYLVQGCCARWWIRKKCHHTDYNSTWKKRCKITVTGLLHREINEGLKEHGEWKDDFWLRRQWVLHFFIRKCTVHTIYQSWKKNGENRVPILNQVTYSPVE